MSVNSFTAAFVLLGLFWAILHHRLTSFCFFQTYFREALWETFHSSAAGPDLFQRLSCDLADVLWCHFDVSTGSSLLFPPPAHGTEHWVCMFSPKCQIFIVNSLWIVVCIIFMVIEPPAVIKCWVIESQRNKRWGDRRENVLIDRRHLYLKQW